jgi:hypothetical protein
VHHVALAACLLAPPPAHAGRPLVADDASLLGPGQCTFETWLEHHPDDHQYWAVPHCRWANWELQAGLGEFRPTIATGAASSWLIAGKTVFRPLARNDWGIGLVLADQVGAGNGATGNLFANVPLSFSLLDDSVRIHLNAGWARQRGGRNGASWAAAGEWSVNDRLGLTFEGYGTGPAYVQAGVRYALQSGGIVLDAAVGDRLSLNGKGRYIALGLTISLAGMR